MPNCNLIIEFDRPERIYASGERISGWIRVNVDRNVRCRGLNLSARWETSGRGTPARGNYFQLTLFQGVWALGEQYEYPFEIPAPGGPFTYHGQNVALDHFVSVRADLPWTIDTRVEKAFQMVPGSVVDTHRPDDRPTPASLAHILNKTARIGFTTLLAGGLVLLAFGQWIGAIIAAFAAAIFLLAFRQTLLTWNLGKVQWDVPPTISPRSKCHIRLRVGPVRVIKIRSIQLRLQALEVVHSGPNQKRETFQHEIFAGSYPLAFQPASNETAAIDCTTHIDVPDISAWTIDLPGNQVIWHFQLTIHLGWLLNWSETRHIRFVPLPETRLAPSAAASND